MAVQTRDTLKAFFETGDFPTQANFWDWLDSFIHASDLIAIAQIAGLQTALNALQTAANTIPDLDHVTQQGAFATVDLLIRQASLRFDPDNHITQWGKADVGGMSVTALGEDAAEANTGTNVTAIGQAAGKDNSFDNVILVGPGATATGASQIAFKVGTRKVIFDAQNLSGDATLDLLYLTGLAAQFSTINTTLTAKADLVAGKVPAAQLPSFVDDVVEYTTVSAFPGIGETGKIYVATDTNETYRWSGSAYVRIANGAVQSVNGMTGNVTLTKNSVGLSNVPNTDATVASNITQTSGYRFVTDAQIASWNSAVGWGNHATAGYLTSITTTDRNLVVSGGAVTTNKTPQALTDAATIAWDMANGYNASVTLGGNRNLTISNMQAGQYATLKVSQDATGSRTLTLPSGHKVVGGGSGTVSLTTTAGAIDMLCCYYDGTNYFWTIGKNFS